MSIRNQVLRKLNAVEAGAIDAMEEVGGEAITYFRLATANWRGKPRWTASVVLGRRNIQLHIRAIGQNANKWVWVDQGTGLDGPSRSTYKIPRNPGRIAFRTGYNAKTAPIARANVGDGSYSGGWVTARQIDHPGIRRREFTETFVEDFTPEILSTLRRHIARKLR